MGLQKRSEKSGVIAPYIASYEGVVEWLDNNWNTAFSAKTLRRMQQLDKALGSPSKSLDLIAITGTAGKSLTADFTLQILTAEGIKTGTITAPHIRQYNERICVNNEKIDNLTFATANIEVLSAATAIGENPTSLEVLTLAGILHFSRTDTQVALLEVTEGGKFNPAYFKKPSILAIARAGFELCTSQAERNIVIDSMLGAISQQTTVIAADQSKLTLQKLTEYVTTHKGRWAMPVRKIAPIPYPYEHLHGRCAALAERIAKTYLLDHSDKIGKLHTGGLLIKPRSQRGRPTTERRHKMESERHTTPQTFWGHTTTNLEGRFQQTRLDGVRVVLDTVRSTDSVELSLLGLKLLHYKEPASGMAVIMGLREGTFDIDRLLKAVRYFFKKITGEIILTDPGRASPGQRQENGWDLKTICSSMKAFGIKARRADSIVEAIEIARQRTSKESGLIGILGSESLISEYIRHFSSK